MKKLFIIGLFTCVAASIGFGLVHRWYPGSASEAIRHLWHRSEPEVTPTDEQQEQAHTITTIIFDLGGVLLETDSNAVAKQLGTWRVSNYLLWHRTSITDVLQKLVRELCQEEGFCPADGDMVASWYGEPMPPTLCKWQRGQLSNQETLDIMCNYVTVFWNRQKNGGKKYFASKTERDLIVDVLHLIFDVRQRIKTTVPVKAGWQLLKKLAQERTKNGKPRYRFLILSNVDKEMVPELFRQFPKLFAYFDGGNGLYSGREGCLKPERAMYEHLCAQYHVKPHECLLIDDQEENVKGAHACGLLGVHWNSEQPMLAEKQLRTLKLLH